MPFDPTLPISGTPLQSAVMRGQFNGLKDLIDAVSGVTSAVFDAVTTLPSGSQAMVNVSVVGTGLHLAFGIPAGVQGEQGMQGQTGPDGPSARPLPMRSWMG